MSEQQQPTDRHRTDDDTASGQSVAHKLRHMVTGGGTGLLAGGCTLGSLMALIGGVTGLIVGGFQGWEAFYADFVQSTVEAGQGSGVFLVIWVPFFLIYVVFGSVMGLVSGALVGLVSGLMLGGLVGLFTGSGIGFGMNKVGSASSLQSWQTVATIVASLLASIALSFLIITFFTSGIEDVFDGTAINGPSAGTPTAMTTTTTATSEPAQASAIANLTALPRRTPRPTLTPLPDFATYNDPDGAFSIAVPATWQAVPSADTSPANASAQFTTDDPLTQLWVFALPLDAPLSQEEMQQQLEQVVLDVHGAIGSHNNPTFQTFDSRVEGWNVRQVFTALPNDSADAFLRGEGYARIADDRLHIIVFTSDYTAVPDGLIQAVGASYQP